MTTYKVVAPDGVAHIVRSRGPWFVVWRLSRRCRKAWGTDTNEWLVRGGWVRRRTARAHRARLALEHGWSEGSVCDARMGGGEPRLMCGARNVKIIRGEVVD